MLYILAMCMYWLQVSRDEKLRRFCLQSCMDFPVYTVKMDLTHVCYAGYESMWGAFWLRQNISPVSFASVYGYIMRCMRLLCEHSEGFIPMELCEHCVKSSVAIWGIPQAQMDPIWSFVMQ